MHEAQPRDSDRGPAASDRIVQGPESSDAFAAAFDGEPGAGIEPYIRLVPPEGPESDAGDANPGVDPSREPRVPVVFDPAAIHDQEYRLLARALTNDDLDTDHRAQMALVQLVKFLRAAGVSVPDFPDTASVPDPGTSADSGPR